MKYDGEIFLSKLYNDMHLHKGVIHSSNINDKKLEKIKKYLDRQEKTHQQAKEHRKLELLKNAYYDKYIIKEIPKEYIEFLDKTTFNKTGYHLTQEVLKEHKKFIIENQKKSLSKWIDYLTNESMGNYPWWVKYWVFQGVLKIGSYDNENDIYGKRDEKTVAPFIELNIKILTKTIDLLVKEIKNEPFEAELKELISSRSFAKIYTALLKKQKKTQSDNKDIEGKWIKYNQGNNYEELLKSLEGYNTGWCTAREVVCKEQLKCGYFYIYYTKDKNNEYKVPRVAIYMDKNEIIEEIRGIEKGQNIESHLEEVLEKKLKEFKDGEKYKLRINDSKILTSIYTKNQNKKDLTKEELRFIYEIDRKIESFGDLKDPRINMIKEGRDYRKDLAVIFKCNEEEVKLTEEEYKNSKNVQVYVGDFNYDYPMIIEKIKIPRVIIGNANFKELTSAKGLENLEIISKSARFDKLTSAKGLENLETIGESVYFDKLTSAKGLNKLKSIGYIAYFYNLIDAEGLDNLEFIGATAYFNNLTNIDNLEKLKTIGKRIYLKEEKTTKVKIRQK